MARPVTSPASRFLVGALVVGACVPRQQVVEDSFDIAESAAAPEISEVLDIGGGDVPLAGELRVGPSDGVATIGETIWIRGGGFGRQPSVTVGGRPAAVLARTHDGGIVARVPPGTPPGAQPVAVANDRGRGERPLQIRRYAAVMPGAGGRIVWAEITGEGPVATGLTTAVDLGQLLALSADGRAAFVGDTGRSTINVVEIPAAGAPQSVYRLDLGPDPVLALVAAGRAPVLAVVRAADVLLLDTSSPLHPARSTPRALPPEVRAARIAAADLSPDGRLLAIATEEGNRLVVLDLGSPGRAPMAAAVALVSDVRASVLCDVAFSPAGDTLWVVAGDTTRSRPTGPQPTQILAVRLGREGGAGLRLEVARTVQVPAAADPTRLGTGRALPLASGSAIRLPPERASVFLAARVRSDRERAAGLPAPGAAAPGPVDKAPGRPDALVAAASVFRVGAEDAAAVAVEARGLIGLAALTADGRWLLAPVAGEGGGLRLLASPADARPGPSRAVQLIPAGAPAPARGGEPPPQLRIQP